MGSRLRMRIRASPPGPSGRHRAGSVGPKITTPDAPTAAARCDTPESLPTNADASRAIAATVGKSRSFRTGTPASRKIGSIEASAGPRMTATTHFVILTSSFVIQSGVCGAKNPGLRCQHRRKRRELIRRPILAGTPAARKNHNQIRTVAFRFAPARATPPQDHPESVRSAHRSAKRPRQSPANSPPTHARRRPAGTDETKPRHQSPPPVAHETANRQKQRTSRYDRNPQRTAAHRPTSHQRTTPQPRAHRSNARAQRHSSPPQAAPTQTAPSARPMPPDAAAKSPPAPASSTSDRPSAPGKITSTRFTFAIGDSLPVKPTVGFTLPWAGVTPAP